MRQNRTAAFRISASESKDILLFIRAQRNTYNKCILEACARTNSTIPGWLIVRALFTGIRNGSESRSRNRYFLKRFTGIETAYTTVLEHFFPGKIEL
jgi:hypothetical protein